MAKTAKDVVAKAVSQIGVKESPSGSNLQKYGKAYGWNGVPWCCQFVWWVFAQCGASSIFYDSRKVAYCPYVVTWAKKAGLWLGRTAKTQPGDIVLFAKANGVACHIGIVEKRISASQVQTIEGNTSRTSNDNGGAVMRRTRDYGNVGSSWYILGFVRPKYSAAASTAPKKAAAPAKASTAKFPLPPGHWYGTPKSDSRNHSGYYSAGERPAIRKIQAKVGVTADGYYGAKTKAAVVKWQKAHKLTADGEVGVKTWTKMFG